MRRITQEASTSRCIPPQRRTARATVVGRWAIGLLAAALVTGNLAVSKASSEVPMKLQSKYAFPDTLNRLKTVLESHGFTIFAAIDHQAAARSVGLEMPPTTVLIYGNPKGGTPLMIAAPDFALELPLRVLVREGEAGKTYVTLNPVSALDGKHGLPPGMALKLAPAEALIAGEISDSAQPK